MNDDIDKLKRDYRNIKAPAHLATRIRAEVADRPIRGHAWMPVGATLMVVVAALWLVPYLAQVQQTPSATPTKPSLSALATLKPDKPSVAAPSMTQLRSVKRPSLPPKPKLAPAKPKTHIEFENELLEEKDHAYS